MGVILLSMIFITLNIYRNTSNDQQFRLSKMNEIKDYFIAELREIELMSKNLK